MIFKKKTKGLIKFLNLQEFWENKLSNSEKNIISQLYGDENLVKGDITTTQTKIGFLGTLLSYFHKPEYYELALKVINEADKIVNDNLDILDLHFYFHSKIVFFYRNREIDNNLENAIKACEDQIKIAPKSSKAFKEKWKNSPLPLLLGFKQLAIIKEKQKKYKEAIKICVEAQKQGWDEDWDKRINRIKKKLNNN